MPASRSRTQEWRRSLQQVCDRGGAIEFAVANPSARSCEPVAHVSGGDIVWRVRLLKLTDTEMVLEQPNALGRPIEIHKGMELVGAIAIGQNRWLFRSQMLGALEVTGFGPRPIRAVRIRMPETVDRSSRRSLRVSTADLRLPAVEVWPLLDPRSVVIAERWNEVAFEAALAGDPCPAPADPESLMPTTGPRFVASLMNLGGGGVGLRVTHEDAPNFSRHRLFWIRLSLEPELPVPICCTGKLVHTHIDSLQCTYAGIAFDFTFNPVHERFVADQIRRYIMMRQELLQQARDQFDQPQAGDAGRAAA
ncbi:MAG: hypothetical protein U0572_04470 [Phycisphaerales bacterium]